MRSVVAPIEAPCQGWGNSKRDWVPNLDWRSLLGNIERYNPGESSGITPLDSSLARIRRLLLGESGNLPLQLEEKI